MDYKNIPKDLFVLRQDQQSSFSLSLIFNSSEAMRNILSSAALLLILWYVYYQTIRINTPYLLRLQH